MAGEDRDPLMEPVFCGGTYKPFAEVSLEEARQRGAELGEVGGWGPLAKVAGVAMAWRDLATEMERAGVPRVAGLDRKTAVEFARRLWVVPPRGSLL